jgi:hypothetical protein
LTNSPLDAILGIEREVNEMSKFVEISKRSKKEQKAYYALQRNVNGFNTGTRTMKTVKNPTRAMIKDADRKGKEIY